MKICESCKKKVFGGKHREVSVDGKTASLCPDCGTIELTAPDGARVEGRVQAVHPPRRKSQKGRNITFHVEASLQNGDRIREASFSKFPMKVDTLPGEYRVLGVRPLLVTETLEAPEGAGGAKPKKPRRRKKRVGYAIRACSF
jgi:hypothetical protein